MIIIINIVGIIVLCKRTRRYDLQEKIVIISKNKNEKKRANLCGFKTQGRKEEIESNCQNDEIVCM